MKTGLALPCLLSTLALCARALAADPAPAADAKPLAEAPKPTSSESAASAHDAGKEDTGGHEHADEQFGHAMQVGLRAGITGGYRVIFRYDKSPFCRTPDPTKQDKDQQKFCGNGAPFATDLGLSFGVFDFVEPYFWARFGLKGEGSTNTKALTAIGLGARIYTMSDSKLKIFVEPAVGMELEGGAGSTAWNFHDGTATGTPPSYKTDFLFHLGVGPHYDFARAFGIYVNGGMTTGILRYIHTELEITGGVQVRVP